MERNQDYHGSTGDYWADLVATHEAQNASTVAQSAGALAIVQA